MSDQSSAPAPKEWEPPDGDQEFVFESMDAAPEWVDRGWAGFDHGPALQVPAGDIFGTPPYHTKTAHVGDTVKFVAAKGAKPAHFEVIEGTPDPSKEGQVTRKIPQVTNASLEDMVRTGSMAVDDLSDEAKGQLAARTPSLQKLVEEGKGAPEPQAPDTLVKLS